MRAPFPALAAILLMGATAHADPIAPGKEGELAKFVAPQDGNRICYARSYTADHLKAHPGQKVTEIGFRLTYYVHEAAPDLPQGQRNYYFELIARLRGHAKQLTASGECVPKGETISCFVECDGGGIRVRRRGAENILIDFGSAAGGRIRMSEGCDAEEGAVDLEPGADDREFLLSRRPDSECPALEDW